MKLDYRIVVPSRKRVHLVDSFMTMLPDAVICCPEDETESYEAHPLANEVWGHPPVKCIGAVRAWMRKRCESECLVMIDDDLRFVRIMIGRYHRRCQDPDAIRRIIENAYVCAKDLGLHLFNWTRDPRPICVKDNNPFNFTTPSASAWGIIGDTIQIDPTLTRAEDLDATLQALRTDRIIFSDGRFYWDFGFHWKGVGGLQGIRTNEKELRDTQKLKNRWGDCLNIEGQGGGGYKPNKRSQAFSIRVNRKSVMATTR